MYVLPPISAGRVTTHELTGGETAVLYTSTQHPQPEAYAFAEAAVEKVLAACGGGEIAFVCRYTQAFAIGTVEEVMIDDRDVGLITLAPMREDLAFDSEAVTDCRKVYERIMEGEEGGHGFLEMTEEMRRQKALMAEEEELYA